MFDIMLVFFVLFYLKSLAIFKSPRVIVIIISPFEPYVPMSSYICHGFFVYSPLHVCIFDKKILSCDFSVDLFTFFCFISKWTCGVLRAFSAAHCGLTTGSEVHNYSGIQ